MRGSACASRFGFLEKLCCKPLLALLQKTVLVEEITG
jgi:hypothetical protein